MSERPDDPRPAGAARLSGGVFVALGMIAGLVGGTLAREPIVGLLAGTGAGLLLLLLVWVRDRRRS